jgi:MraZ protein
MLLTGTFERSLDEKLRLALPKPLREALAHERQLLLTPGTDGSLALFPGGAFAALAAKLASKSPTGRDVRAFSRLLYAQSQSVEIDSQGRIRLSGELARAADLRDDVVLIGVGDHVELWNKSRWAAYFAAQQPQYDRLAEGAFGESSAPPANGGHEWSPSGGREPNEDEAVTRPMQPR